MNQSEKSNNSLAQEEQRRQNQAAKTDRSETKKTTGPNKPAT
jgi:hypothetical protein